jgi:hypothetical protein
MKPINSEYTTYMILIIGIFAKDPENTPMMDEIAAIKNAI